LVEVVLVKNDKKTLIPKQDLEVIQILLESGGKGGGSFAEDFPRRRRPLPNNPHDPTSKDPFMRAGLSMGTNKTKIFKRAGMSMGG